MKQAESATKTAQSLMDAVNFCIKLMCLCIIKDLLRNKKTIVTFFQQIDSDYESTFKKEKKELLDKIKNLENDRDTIKTQAINLQEEYDRVCTLLNKNEVNFF